MYLKHIDPYGNELGLYRSIKEASNKIGSPIEVLSIVVRHKLDLQDGSKLFRSALNTTARRQVSERKRQALQEWIRIATPSNLLAKKYNLSVQDVCRVIERHKTEQKLHEAYMEYLVTGDTVSSIASKHDVSGWSLAARIKRGAKA